VRLSGSGAIADPVSYHVANKAPHGRGQVHTLQGAPVEAHRGFQHSKHISSAPALEYVGNTVLVLVLQLVKHHLIGLSNVWRHGLRAVVLLAVEDDAGRHERLPAWGATVRLLQAR
jgi:hypothetical protein